MVRIFFMKSPSKISAVIITYNEEKYIQGCIVSLKDIADEILVVDSFSLDRTKAICLELGARFIERKWEGYAKTKNWANAQAKYAWVLSMDADEVLSKDLRSSILSEKMKGLNDRRIYKFNRLNNYCGKWIRHAGWYPDTKVRLFDKTHAIWQGDVHEELSFSQTVDEIHLKGDLLHYTIMDKEDHISRLKKYNGLAKKYPNLAYTFFSSMFTFIKMYILKLGFLDGQLGFQLCFLTAKGKFWRGKA
ncbi:MAG: glycosyltransferase family 2 protein [Bacteroidia bacterium]